MELIALRYTFSGMNDYGKPYGVPLCVDETHDSDELNKVISGTIETEADGFWEIKTHDRGKDEGRCSKTFFQLCFRLVGADIEGCTIAITTPSKTIPLYYDEENDLWYQRTMFDNDGRPVIDTESGVYLISTAGVFKVSVRKANGKAVITKRIAVYPNLIDEVGYKKMLDRLLAINEKLIISNSYVGIGKNSRPDDPDGRYDSGGEWDIRLWNELKPQLDTVMRIPPDLLRKEYSRMRIEKNRQYDSRVMRSICRNGGHGRVDGISFVGDNDTYENRAIRFILSRLGEQEEKKETKIDAALIDESIKDDVKNTFNSFDTKVLDDKLAIYDRHDRPGTSGTFRINTVRCATREVKAKLSYNFQNKEIRVESGDRNDSLFPLCKPDDEDHPYRIILETESADTALKFLDWLFGVFQSMKSGKNCKKSRI